MNEPGFGNVRDGMRMKTNQPLHNGLPLRFRCFLSLALRWGSLLANL